MPRRSFILITVFFVAAALVAGLVAPVLQRAATAPSAARTLVAPKLSMRAGIGKAAYDDVCVACHGDNGGGTDQGPSLVHPIFNPGHHADEAFFRVVRDSVRAHHWRHGDMPAQPDVGNQKVVAIALYVRELQRANGIGTQEHRM